MNWLTRKIVRWALNRHEKGFGDQVISRIMLSQGLNYTWPGGWSQDRLQQVQHFRHWVYTAIRVIMDMAASHQPHFDYIEEGGRGTKNMVWHRSLSAIRSSDIVEPIEHDHPLRELFRKPNTMDTYYDLASELALMLQLTGNGFLWAVPNKFGMPVQLWVLPSQWVWMRPGTRELVDYYELRPWTSYAGAPLFRILARDMIHIRMKSPITKLDGYGALTALAQPIDIHESILTSQWASFKNGVRPGLSLELAPEYGDPTDAQLERIYQKFFARFQSEINDGLPMILAPGMKLNTLTFAPYQMAWTESMDQTRDTILAAFGVPKAVVGLIEQMTFGAVLGTMAGFCAFKMNPYFAMVGQALSAHLAPRFRSERSIKIWYPDSTPIDPEQVNRDLRLDGDLGLLTYNEGRAVRGRAPYPEGGDKAIRGAGYGDFDVGIEEEAKRRRVAELLRVTKDWEELGRAADAAGGVHRNGHAALRG